MKAREGNGNHNKGLKHEVFNSKAMGFEFQRGNGANGANHHRISASKSTPSKWDDAQKWIFGLPKGGEKEQSKIKHRNSNADDLRLIASVSQEHDKGTEEQEGNEGFLSAMSRQCEEETKKIECDDPIWRINKPGGNSMTVVRSICVRDMGTEMTPIASQEPSRTATPVRARTPVLQSPISSGSSTPARSQHAMQASEDCRKTGLASTAIMNKYQSSAQAVKMHSMETRAMAWDEAERAKHMARYKREEVRIQAWETCEKRKAESKMRKTEGDDSMKDGENDAEKNKYNEGERVEEEWMDSLVNSAINVGSMFDPLIGSVHAAGTGLYRQENELDGPSGEDAYLNPVADNVAPIVPVGDVEIREGSVPEDVVPKQDVIVNNIQVREAEEDVIVTEDVEDVVPKVLDDVVMGGEDKPNELNLTDKGHEECAASVEAAGGIVGQNVQRQPRNRKRSEKIKEPYTDEFGSAEPVMKKVPKKKRTKAGGKATGAKKMKVNSDIVNPAKDVDEAALRDENDPSFDIGLTPVLIELQGKKDDK